MEFLLNYGFNENDINDVKELNQQFVNEKIDEYKELVIKNIEFLKELGVNNYPVIFKRHTEMFLMDDDAFAEIFKKYDRQDLIIKLQNNPDLVEQL